MRLINATLPPIMIAIAVSDPDKSVQKQRIMLLYEKNIITAGQAIQAIKLYGLGEFPC